MSKIESGKTDSLTSSNTKTKQSDGLQRTCAYAVTCHPTSLCESNRIGEGTRVWAYAHIMNGATIGRDCNICDHVFIESGVTIGHRATIKNRVLLFSGVTIADDVFVGPGVIFTNDRYPRSPRMAAAATRYAETDNWLEQIHVSDGASIGAGAIIQCGVTIGQFATIGAGAVVTRDVAPHALVVGTPARRVGWVCVCGITLPSGLICKSCGREFNCKDGILTEPVTHSPIKPH